jgi:hypothetical protein
MNAWEAKTDPNTGRVFYQYTKRNGDSWDYEMTASKRCGAGSMWSARCQIWGAVRTEEFGPFETSFDAMRAGNLWADRMFNFEPGRFRRIIPGTTIPCIALDF